MYENIQLISTQADRFVRTAERFGPVPSVGLGGLYGPNQPHIFFVDPTTGFTSGDGRDPRRPLSTLQAAIDLCERLRGDIIVVARGGHTPTEAINVNKRGITIVAENYGGNRQNMDEHWIYADASYTTGPVLEITQGCRIIGLTIVGRSTTIASARATADSLAAGTPNANYVELIECVFPGWGGGSHGFEFRGANLGAVRRCTFTALSNSGGGVVFRGSGSNNPVQNLVEECLFLNCEFGIKCPVGAGLGTPVDNWFHSNRFHDINTDAIYSGGGVGENFVSDNYFEVDDDNAFDLNHADMLTAEWILTGNHYIEA